jgi:hypothetical protein
MYWLRQRSPLTRTLLYVAVAALALVLAAGMGAMVALVLRGDLSSPGTGEPQALDGREDVTQGQEEDAAKQHEESAREQQAAKDEEAAARRDEAEYVDAVGKIQERAVEAFQRSHRKLLRYDALTASDVEAMQANKTALEEAKDQTADLAPPRKFEEQYEVFSASVDELHEATRLAHGMAADPVAAAELGFDEYDGQVNEASDLLQRSNELLNREYETIENVREISPEF